MALGISQHSSTISGKSKYIAKLSHRIYRSTRVHIQKLFCHYFTSKCAGYFCQIMYL